MAHVETDAGETFLYTGDFKTRKGLSAKAIDIPHADTIVMETTLGAPIMYFPILRDLSANPRLCDRANTEKKTPVLLAYSLGKAQELTKIIEGRSQSLMVYKTIGPLNQVYASFGVSMPQTRPLDFLRERMYRRHATISSKEVASQRLPRSDGQRVGNERFCKVSLRCR